MAFTAGMWYFPPDELIPVQGPSTTQAEPESLSDGHFISGDGVWQPHLCSIGHQGTADQLIDVLLQANNGKHLEDRTGALGLHSDAGEYQKWKVRTTGEGDNSYYLTSYEDKGVTACDAGMFGGPSVEMDDDSTPYRGRWWTFQEAGDGKYFITSVTQNMQLEANNGKVKLSNDKGDDQKWTICKGTDGHDPITLEVDKGLIERRSTAEWVGATNIVVASAKKLAPRIPDCVAFAVHPHEGVRFYSGACFDSKHRLSSCPIWTTYTFDEAKKRQSMAGSGRWFCSNCTFINTEDLDQCSVCYTTRPSKVTEYGNNMLAADAMQGDLNSIDM